MNTVIYDIIDSLPRRDKGITTQKVSYRTRELSKITGIVLHCTDGAFDTPQSVAQYHTSPCNHISAKGCPAIAYTLFITRDGQAFQTLDLEEVGWHAGASWNGHLMGVAMAYKASGAMEPPPEVQMTATVEAVAHTCLHLGILPGSVVGHRELFGTGWGLRGGRKYLMKECPGMLVNLDKFRKDVTMKIQEELGIVIDGVFGPETKEAMELYVPGEYSEK